MSATATMDTPTHRKAFKMEAVEEDCRNGWVILKEGYRYYLRVKYLKSCTLIT